MHRVAVLHVEVIEHLTGIHEAVALSCSIGEIGFREVILQPGEDARDIVSVAVEVEGSHALQVTFYLADAESVGAEAHLRNVSEERQECIGAATSSQSVDPEKRSAGTIIRTQSEVGKRGIDIGFHQAGNVLADNAFVDMQGRIAQ